DLVEAEDFPLQGIELHEDSFEYELTRQTDTVEYRFCGLRKNSASCDGYKCTLEYREL
ncbi:hypothetical protein GGH91_006463, partial [Coemansia sp. RSA 2671]